MLDHRRAGADAARQGLASSSFLPMHVFVLAAVFYYLMSFPLMRAAEYLEARMGQGR